MTPSPAGARAAAFLDRDGTINRPAAEGEYITGPDALELLGHAAEAVALLHRAGLVVVVVSNQRGVALGQMSTTDLGAVDARLRALTGIEHSYYCTHGLEHRCDCRKPRAGLLIRAAAELGIDLAGSWMVGDRQTDREAGERAGCRTLLVEPEDGALLAAAHRIVAATAAPA